jgi:uncharacterized protein YegP (UPF0339 family)
MVVKAMTPALGDSPRSASRGRVAQVAEGGNPAERHTYAISVDRDGHFRWTLFAPNGQIAAASAVGFVSELTAERALEDEAACRSVQVSPRFPHAA